MYAYCLSESKYLTKSKKCPDGPQSPLHKCECDQFKQLWHSRITCDAIDSNNMMYKTFKYSHGKEKYTEILPEHFKKTLFQFRMGTHKLPVNNSKHLNVPRADRHYKYKL